MRYRTSRILEAMHAERPNSYAERAVSRLRDLPKHTLKEAAMPGRGVGLLIGDALGDYWHYNEPHSAFLQRIADKLVAEAKRLGVPMEDV